MTISTDLVYDVLRKHQPDHLLLRAAYADASTGLLDIRRLADMLARVRGHAHHVVTVGVERVVGQPALEAEVVQEHLHHKPPRRGVIHLRRVDRCGSGWRGSGGQARLRIGDVDWDRAMKGI